MSIIESHPISSSSELSWFSSSCLLVHVPITIFFLNVMNNLQLLSSILHYNSCTKDETKLKPNHFIVTNTMNARVQVVKVQSYVLWWKSILHFLWKSGSQSLEEERRDTESTLLEVQCKVSTVSDGLGCHVICWCWSTVFSEVQGQHSRIPGSFRALHASCCWPTLWRCRFHFPTGLGTCTQCQSYQYLV